MKKNKFKTNTLANIYIKYMNYDDHNFIEITQQTKLRVALVVSSESSCAV